MLSSTLENLVCPKLKRNIRCGGSLRIAFSNRQGNLIQGDVIQGQIQCLSCQSEFPVLAGVAILVDDVREYLLTHIKGISQLVSDSEIPVEFREEYLEVKEELMEALRLEHVDDDLEAARIVSLYFMNHYLSAKDPLQWWKAASGHFSPLIDELVMKYWDQGPFAQIEKWLGQVDQKTPAKIVELGCGVGGLFQKIRKQGSYLGVDSSFASIALARHLNLGAPYPEKIKVPEDLLWGPTSRVVDCAQFEPHSGQVDFIVGDAIAHPVKSGVWDYSIALNTIDMLDEPSQLPKVQHELLKTHGSAIQSCPYIWHEKVISKLRGRLPRGMSESSQVAEWLYEKAGFQIEQKLDHLPWLFFKHVRQLEIYSVHLFRATRLN